MFKNKYLIIKTLYIFILLSTLSNSFLQAQPLPPKRELRGVWIATVANIDWPSQKNLSPAVQQQEFNFILDEHARNGMNAVFVQVRPVADAFYRSKYEPWSEWLTGKQGTEPNPPYDPLSFMIGESHKRGMEFHAWFNPYRATFDTVSSRLSPTHISKQHPEWLLTYAGRKLFDPGLPQVREYIVQVILDVVRNYDVDGIHFDDYFYPYPVAGDTLKDDSTFIKYTDDFASKDDWRRNNVNLLIQMVADSIKSVKPYVKFGVSPFGVWRNKADDPGGSDTRAGQSSFTHLFADSRLWIKHGWVDYILPQVYFSTRFGPVNYKKLTQWWATQTYNRHIYIGHGPYKINKNADSTWFEPQEIPRQIRFNRNTPQVKGSVYFSSKSLMANPNHVQDSLRNDLYKFPALIPTMPWLDSIPPLAPIPEKTHKNRQGITLHWHTPLKAIDGDTAYYYLIYRFNHKENINLEDPGKLLAKLPSPVYSYTDNSVLSKKRYVYMITAVDRLHNESIAGKPVKVKAKKKK
ncbi:family 10 glycosylhydrolase [Rhodocytophaga rosea]|uniref:Family 10 glycosylhydrolase n=1 Tax=Rhodocytophaga rosea TaxID=2704465 RepID=A0A6C0GSV0_9BACT|nr:family 10 glycosylhydrolase [Rhodocytophaga rosea]QHT71219.1 family 10 glycosylhydrolase [Rhodocytophaga rosea]